MYFLTVYLDVYEQDVIPGAKQCQQEKYISKKNIGSVKIWSFKDSFSWNRLVEGKISGLDDTLQ